MLDLDSIHLLELKNEGEIEEDAFRFVKVLEYTTAEVGNKELNSIFVRGSSRKETIQVNHQLIIFLLHEDQLFSWFGGYRGSGTNKLILVNEKEGIKIISDKIEIQDENTLYFS
jgi:hypothetical protein